MKPTNEEIRQHITQMMIRGEWHGTTSRDKLAEEWGVAPRTIGDRALEVSRAITLNRDVKGWVEAKLLQLDADAEQARSLGKPRDAAYCIELQAKLLGAMAPVKRQEVAPAEKVESEEELWKRIEELRKERKEGAH